MKSRISQIGVMLAAGAVALSGLTVIASSSGAASKPTYTIAFQGILSGGSAALGINEDNGVKLAVADWQKNAHRKFNIKLISADDQGDPTVAPSIATQIASNSKVVAVVGPSYSGATVASIPVYGPSDMPIVSPSATRVSITEPDPSATPPVTVPTNAQYKDFFRDVPNDSVQGPADANYIVKTLSKTNVEVINDASSYGAGLADDFVTTATADGATVTTATLPSTTACGNGGTGTNDQITIPSGIQAVFYGGYYCDFAQMTDIVRTAGYTGVLMSGDGSDDPHYMVDLSKQSDGEGVYLTCACKAVTNSTPAGKLFNTGYQKLFKTQPGAYSAESYDAANMIFAAMGKISKVTRKNITNELKKLTYVGVSKTIKFTSSGDVASKVINIYKVEETTNPNGVSANIVQVGSSTP